MLPSDWSTIFILLPHWSILTGGARGPGVFFIIPCVDVYEKIDMRTTTYEIPPQEVTLA